MAYLWIKALHLLAVIVFIAGLLAMAIAGRGPDATWRRVARQADWQLASPALALVWVSGPLLAVLGHWWSAPWLMVKLVFVLLLSALHGRVSGTLRRMERDNVQAAPGWLARVVPIVVVVVALVAVTVVVKPF